MPQQAGCGGKQQQQRIGFGHRLRGQLRGRGKNGGRRQDGKRRIRGVAAHPAVAGQERIEAVFGQRRQQRQAGVEAHGSARGNDQGAVGQGPGNKNLQDAVGDRGAAGVGIRATEAQPARAALGQIARAADGSRERGPGRVVLSHGGISAEGDGSAAGEGRRSDDVEHGSAAAAEGQPAASQIRARGDGQRAGAEGGSAAVGIRCREHQRSRPVLPDGTAAADRVGQRKCAGTAEQQQGVVDDGARSQRAARPAAADLERAGADGRRTAVAIRTGKDQAVAAQLCQPQAAGDVGVARQTAAAGVDAEGRTAGQPAAVVAEQRADARGRPTAAAPADGQHGARGHADFSRRGVAGQRRGGGSLERAGADGRRAAVGIRTGKDQAARAVERQGLAAARLADAAGDVQGGAGGRRHRQIARQDQRRGDDVTAAGDGQLRAAAAIVEGQRSGRTGADRVARAAAGRIAQGELADGLRGIERETEAGRR